MDDNVEEGIPILRRDNHMVQINHSNYDSKDCFFWFKHTERGDFERIEGNVPQNELAAQNGVQGEYVTENGPNNGEQFNIEKKIY